ncbi:hypothetical protein [Streptomyces sp. XY431]|uniref:hypothetical protein n=1 Tax=Streptomyces sp. XY431 TaxID=1415562 RepID=UPI0006AEE634|nr:hypothetical protein [Streptomyces sp. XY431]
MSTIPPPPSARRLLAAATAAAALSLGTAPLAVAAPGDNGDVKVHDSNTPVNNRNDDPRVCRFYLDAFDFDTVQLVNWTIEQQPPTGNAQVLAGAIVLPDGTGTTSTYSLPDGHYKLLWNFVGENGTGKQKVFEVQCASSSPSPTATTSPSATPSPSLSATPSPGGSPSPSSKPTGAPHGGVGTGGGGTSGASTAQVLGGAGLIAAAAVLGLRALRRRPGRNAAS